MTTEGTDGQRPSPEIQGEWSGFVPPEDLDSEVEALIAILGLDMGQGPQEQNPDEGQ